MIDGHMHLENGPLTKEYVLAFVEEAKRKGMKTIHILDHTHRFIEFEPIYEDLRALDVQDTWLNNKSMKFKSIIIKGNINGISILYCLFGLYYCFYESKHLKQNLVL